MAFISKTSQLCSNLSQHMGNCRGTKFIRDKLSMGCFNEIFSYCHLFKISITYLESEPLVCKQICALDY